MTKVVDSVFRLGQVAMKNMVGVVHRRGKQFFIRKVSVALNNTETATEFKQWLAKQTVKVVHGREREIALKNLTLIV